MTEPAQNFDAAKLSLGGYDDLFFTGPEMLKWHNRADWHGTTQAIRAFAGQFLRDARNEGIPLLVLEAYRSEERQRDLHAQGFTKIEGPLAPHTVGCAIDVVHPDKLWNASVSEWELIEHLGKRAARQLNMDIVWGGDWQRKPHTIGWDAAHWQLRDWRKMRFTQEVKMTPVGLFAEAKFYSNAQKSGRSLPA